MSQVTPLNHRPDDLAPFRPGKDGPWDLSAAAHLSRRAAFGAPPERLERLLEQGPVAAARELFEAAEEPAEFASLDDITRRKGSREGFQAWWIYRMLHAPRPAREKLALFWHGHFATSDRKVEDPRLLGRQVRLFQTKGTGSFEELLLEIARDPAMIIWLDGNSNRKGRPNENFARELFELFSLGIGNYSEKDIQEAARAFTGWHEVQGEFRFRPRSHDKGLKTVLGLTGPLDGEAVVRHAAGLEASARFIARKLFTFYVHPEPSKELTQALGELFRSVEGNTGRFLAQLFASRVFFRPETRRSLVASPVDFTAGALATLGCRASSSQVAELCALMNQELLVPPSVKGWDGGLAWLNSTTLLARYRFATELTRDGSLEAKLDDEVLRAMKPREFLALFFPEGLPPEIERDLVEEAGDDRRLLLSACLALPESQFI